jgi:EAL domain-containing protein (putative c-di-GMP-specific phosphodiesterase class I)
VADLLRQTVREFRFVWEERVFQLGLSVGLVTFSDGKETLGDVLCMADVACYLAKDKGRNRVQIYSPEDTGLALRHGEMGWVVRIQKALEENRFVLYSQKILGLNGLDDGEHYELLLRMQGEDGTLIPPMAFIPAAERYGLMPQLDRWVVTTAFAQYEGRHPPGTSVGTCSINLSGASVCDENFYEFVMEQFALYKVPPEGICFEITETSAIANLTQAVILMGKLKQIGCRFSLDDFGSGMSSFTYLKRLPVDYLKIDGGFVKDMVDDPIDQAMVEAINSIGHVMHIKTIAEFVENNAILDLLRRMGVDYAQGYGIEKPRLSCLSEI